MVRFWHWLHSLLAALAPQKLGALDRQEPMERRTGMRTVLQEIASRFESWEHCVKNKKVERSAEWLFAIEKLVKDRMPSGSGLDAGTKFDFEASRLDRLVLITDFHHMNEHGFYDGWTYHKVIVTPSFVGFDLRITGRDRNQIKDYLYDIFYQALGEER